MAEQNDIISRNIEHYHEAKRKCLTGCAVEIGCLKHMYSDGTSVELCGVQLSIEKKERVVISGKNGSGKSTLIHHMIGLLVPVEGDIKVMGVSTKSKRFKEVRNKIGIVFQDAEQQLIAPTVFDDIAFTPLNLGWGKEKTVRRVNRVMEDLGITHLKDRVPHYLSGGEKKKVALAGALAASPKLLLLDELFSNIDELSKDRIIQYLIKLNKEEGITIVLTTHQPEISKIFATREIRL